MKRMAMGLAATAALIVAGGTANAQDNEHPYSLFLHFTPPSYSGCGEGSVADQFLGCDIVDPGASYYGDFTPNYAWLMVSGVPAREGGSGGIGGAQFGVNYDPTVLVQGWSLCSGGSEIPSFDLLDVPDWPQAGSGNAVTWGGGCYEVMENPDGMTKVGFFTVLPGSMGRLSLTEDPRIDEAQAADCGAIINRICVQSLGYGETMPDALGQSTCGAMCAVPTLETSWSSIKQNYR